MQGSATPCAVSGAGKAPDDRGRYNVLVRYLTNDDPEQARKAVAVLAGADRILVTATVLLELA